MKFLIYLSALVMILSIFTTIEAKKTKKMPFFRKKLPRAMSSGRSSSSMMSSNSNFGRSSSFGSSSFGGHASTSRSMSQRDPANNSEQLKKKEEKKPVSQMSVAKGPTYDKSRPTGVTYGPRGGPRGGLIDGTRYVGGRPRAYGYYRGGFPVWLTSYAVVMNSLEECPAYNEHLEFVQKSYGVCMAICDKLHCIQTANYCCYYVEPAKKLVVAA